jgi:UDPglucose 6-dehydrogenase
VAVWGLAFKPGTDDIREAPAFVLIEQLLSAGADVVATDPVAIAASRRQLGDRVRFETSNYECARDADALVLVTEWRDYRRPNFEKLKRFMRGRVLFDGRNVWDPADVRAAGFTYEGIGRKKG